MELASLTGNRLNSHNGSGSILVQGSPHCLSDLRQPHKNTQTCWQLVSNEDNQSQRLKLFKRILSFLSHNNRQVNSRSCEIFSHHRTKKHDGLWAQRKKKIGAEWKNDYVGMHSCAILFKIEEDYGNSTRGWEPVMSPLVKWFSGPCKVKMWRLCHIWTQFSLVFYHRQKWPIKNKISLILQEIECMTSGQLLLVKQSVIKGDLNLTRFF